MQLPHARVSLVAGVNLIRMISSGNGRLLWRFMQLVFGLCLTVSCFSQSVFGLPFLVRPLRPTHAWPHAWPHARVTPCMKATTTDRPHT